MTLTALRQCAFRYARSNRCKRPKVIEASERHIRPVKSKRLAPNMDMDRAYLQQSIAKNKGWKIIQ
jgi:hypothetical protein